MTTSIAPISLADIEARTKNYADARALLGTRLQQLQDRIEAMRREAMPLIRSALATAKAAEAELSAGISAGPGLFKRPRTYVFHGVRVGIEKGKGVVRIEDPARTVQLIRRHLGAEEAELLVKVSETPIKSALANLPASDLKRVGVEIVDSGDQVVIRPVDSELDKMLNALLEADEMQIEESA
jgi:hypothetical protein